MTVEYEAPAWFSTAEELFGDEFKTSAEFREQFSEKITLYKELSRRLMKETMKVYVQPASGMSGSFLAPDLELLADYVHGHRNEAIEAAAYHLTVDTYTADATNNNSVKLDELVTSYKERVEGR